MSILYVIPFFVLFSTEGCYLIFLCRCMWIFHDSMGLVFALSIIIPLGFAGKNRMQLCSVVTFLYICHICIPYLNYTLLKLKNIMNRMYLRKYILKHYKAKARIDVEGIFCTLTATTVKRVLQKRQVRTSNSTMRGDRESQSFCSHYRYSFL